MCDSDEDELIKSFTKLSREKSLKNINHMDDSSIRTLAGINLYDSPEEINMNNQESFLVNRISELQEKSRKILPTVLNNLLIGIEIIDKDVNNIKYNIWLQTAETSRITYNISKIFEDYYGFSLEIFLKLTQLNIDSKLPIFPRRYKRANFGFTIPDDELLIRCDQLNSWIGALLINYKSYPETVQDNIQSFFMKTNNDRRCNIEIYKSHKKCKILFDSYIQIQSSRSSDISSIFRDSFENSINKSGNDNNLIQWESKKEVNYI
jgi:hypothetical protein